ncbi:MAG: ATP-binding cassette domain-containing protein [Campylobacter sp.]|nr:ATP-binding cassette domain-containing protein [Campylobacter sp.]
MKEIITGRDLTVAYGEKVMHDNVSFTVKESEIYGFLGGSGSGKTTLMKTMIYLKEPKSGTVMIDGDDVWRSDIKKRQEIKLKCGVMFQFGALFSNMNVLDNASVMLEQYSNYKRNEIYELASFWIQKVGLRKEAMYLYPSELSGGMKKRAALARALALSPKILFLDEPNSGLDPMSARQIDRLLLELRDNTGITIVMVTHDIDSIFDILDRFIIINDKKIIYEGDIKNVKDVEDNPLKELFELRQSDGK